MSRLNLIFELEQHQAPGVVKPVAHWSSSRAAISTPVIDYRLDHIRSVAQAGVLMPVCVAGVKRVRDARESRRSRNLGRVETVDQVSDHHMITRAPED